MTRSALSTRATPMARLVGVLILMVALVTTTMSVFAQSASAHASVTEISPEPDSVMGSAPTVIDIKFNEPVSGTGSAIRVFDPSGAQISGVEPHTERTRLSAELPALDAVGSYTVSWKVLSADGHLINGAFLFSIGKPTLTEPLDVADAGTPVAAKGLKVAGALLSWIGLILVLATAGGAGRSRLGRRRIYWAVSVTSIGTLATFVGALLAVDGSLGDSLNLTLQTASGRASLVALVGAGLLAMIVVIRARSAAKFSLTRLRDSDRRLIIGAALVTTGLIALEGHALGLSPVVVSAPLTVIHVLSAIIWLSGLVWIDHRSRVATVPELRQDVRANSKFALISVAALAASGIGLFANRMPIDELVSSTYGILGSIKIVLLAMAVLLAFQNRTSMIGRTVPVESEQEVNESDAVPLEDEALDLEHVHRDALDIRRFKSSLRAEMVLVSVALVVGVFLGQTPPPGTEGVTGGYFSEKLAFGDGKIELTIDPGKRGVNEIHVTALDRNGRLMSSVENLKLSMSLPEKDLGPLEPTLQVISAGHSYTFARIPFGGDWKMTASGTVDRFEERTATFDVTIGD